MQDDSTRCRKMIEGGSLCKLTVAPEGKAETMSVVGSMAAGTLLVVTLPFPL